MSYFTYFSAWVRPPAIFSVHRCQSTIWLCSDSFACRNEVCCFWTTYGVYVGYQESPLSKLAMARSTHEPGQAFIYLTRMTEARGHHNEPSPWFSFAHSRKKICPWASCTTQQHCPHVFTLIGTLSTLWADWMSVLGMLIFGYFRCLPSNPLNFQLILFHRRRRWLSWSSLLTYPRIQTREQSACLLYPASREQGSSLVGYLITDYLVICMLTLTLRHSATDSYSLLGLFGKAFDKTCGSPW